MAKKIVVIGVFILIVIAGFCFAGYYFIFFEKSRVVENKDISELSDQDIVSFLETSQDAKEYMIKNPDFKIESKEILTQESILAGQNGLNFKEVYYGLEMENNRYIKINLMNGSGDNGLVAVIDYKEKTVPKAYGLLLIKAGIQ